jgi:hypothetical protein
MAAVANNPKFAKKAGVSQSVGKDFVKADKIKGAAQSRVDRQVANKPSTRHGKSELFSKGGPTKMMCGGKTTKRGK